MNALMHLNDTPLMDEKRKKERKKGRDRERKKPREREKGAGK